MSGIPGVVGFFTADEVPFSERDTSGRWTHGFANREAFGRVQAGYACGQCLAKFSVYMAVCPICHFHRDVAADVQANPAGWQEYWDQHNYGSGATETRGFEEALDAMAHDPDVEQIPLSKLGPSKRGRGRVA